MHMQKLTDFTQQPSEKKVNDFISICCFFYDFLLNCVCLSVLTSYRLAARLKGLVEQYEVREEVSNFAVEHSTFVMIYS